MNHSLTVMLAHDEVKAVSCVFQKGGTTYTYKTIEQNLQVGDRVGVQARGGTDKPFDMAIVEVAAVDVAVDFDSTPQYKWVISKIDTSMFEALKETEKQI